MASSGTRTLVLTAASLLCARVSFAQGMAPPQQMPPPVVDARRALPMFPTTSWKDGFLLEHAGVPDLGFHARITTLYSRNPLGEEEALSDRVSLLPSVVLSIVKWVDLGLQLPIALWQGSSGFNVSATALGDLRLATKLRLPIPEPFPTFGVSMGIGFPTGNLNSRVSAGQLSFFPRVLVDWMTIRKRVRLVANIGGFLAGTGGTCNPAEQPLDPSDPMKMRRLPCPTVCDPAQQPLDPTDPMMMRRQPCPMMSMEQLGTLSQIIAGLGNHFFYGVGIEAIISPEVGLGIHTELVGSASFTNREGRSPLFWDVGVMRRKSNGWNFGLMYGLGLTPGSPGHTVMGQLGYAWEHKDPEPPKKPTLTVELPPIQVIVPPMTPGGAPAGGAPAAGTAPGASPAQQAPHGGTAPVPAQQAPHSGPAQQAPHSGPAQQAPHSGAAPQQQPPVKVVVPPTQSKPKTVEIEIPDDWWPQKKDDKK